MFRSPHLYGDAVVAAAAAAVVAGAAVVAAPTPMLDYCSTLPKNHTQTCKYQSLTMVVFSPEARIPGSYRNRLQ